MQPNTIGDVHDGLGNATPPQMSLPTQAQDNGDDSSHAQSCGAFEKHLRGLIQRHDGPPSINQPENTNQVEVSECVGNTKMQVPQAHNYQSRSIDTHGQKVGDGRTGGPTQSCHVSPKNSRYTQPPHLRGPSSVVKAGQETKQLPRRLKSVAPAPEQASSIKSQHAVSQGSRDVRARGRPNQKQRRQGASSLQNLDRDSQHRPSQPLSNNLPVPLAAPQSYPSSVLDKQQQASTQTALPKSSHTEFNHRQRDSPTLQSNRAGIQYFNHRPQPQFHHQRDLPAHPGPFVPTGRVPRYDQPVHPNGSHNQQRQLFNPHEDRISNNGQNGQWMNLTAAANQSSFLDKLALTQVREAQITPEELRQKTALRLKLQQICQEAITEHEVVQNPQFDGFTVSLECFGSLGSGFAMTGSDMDLALISPMTHPEPASTESEIPRLLEKRFLELGYGARLLTKTRVPIIRFCEKPTPELAEAMRGARSRWELEREQPAKPKKTDKSKGANSNPTLEACAGKSIEGVVKIKDEVKDACAVSQKGAEAIKAADGATKNNGKIGEVDALQDGEGKPAKQRAILSSSRSYNAAENELDAGLALDTDKKAQTNMDSVTAEGNSATAVVNIPKVTSNVIVDAGNTDQTPQSIAKVRADEELVRLYALAIKEGWYDSTEKSLVVNFIRAVRIHGANADHEDLKAARGQLERLPNVLSRYREPHVNPLDLPKTGVGVQCDINFSNHLAIHNTALLRCYTLCDARVTPMVIFVKAWTKRRNINSPYHGTLSSYGYVLMVLHYLINVCRPQVLPNLQHHLNRGAGLVVDGKNVRFWRDEKEIRRAASLGWLNANLSDTVGSLLRGFFRYYAHPSDGGFQWNTDVLSLRTVGGLLRKQDKGWTGAKTVTIEPNVPGEDAKEVRHRYLFAIEDPFEHDHNIARTVVHNGIVAIRDEFRRAHKIIQAHSRPNVTIRDELFAEAESKEHLQYRYFGPLIPNFGKEKVTANQSTDQSTDQNVKAGKVEEASGAFTKGQDLKRVPDPVMPDPGSKSLKADAVKHNKDTTSSRPQDPELFKDAQEVDNESSEADPVSAYPNHGGSVAGTEAMKAN